MVKRQTITYECSFRADKKLFQVVSSGGWLEWIHLVNDGTVSHHSLDSDGVGVHRALLDELNASSIRSQITSDLARTFGAQI